MYTNIGVPYTVPQNPVSNFKDNNKTQWPNTQTWFHNTIILYCAKLTNTSILRLYINYYNIAYSRIICLNLCNIYFYVIQICVYYREAISAVCERRGVDVESINVYLDQSRTPLPLLTSETSWLGGRHIRIRGKYYFDVQCFYW